MRDVALFMNGVFDSVLQEILQVQSHLPEQILFLQPHSSRAMRQLAEVPPSLTLPMGLFVSISDDLATVRYAGEIVGWDDKRSLEEPTLHTLNRVIYALQPNEGGVYGLGEAGKPDMVNLLHVRRLRRLSKLFSVAHLRLVSRGQPLSTGRTQPGGWSYVVNPDDTSLQPYW
ncbi:hypothetical protein ACFLT5_01675 [Chloroflexota bacterium]